MKLLVVSWGDFERWRETKYRFDEESSVAPSTLPILQKVIKPDWTVIVLSDTLGKDFSSIEALREDVRGRVMNFLDRIGAGREVDILIVPGVGRFAHGTFKGNAMDAYYYLLHEIGQILPPKGNLDVHFDSTHGLNYITLLAYRALKELLGIAAIANKVTFTAYNSDPFVPNTTKELTINVIERSKVSPSPLTESVPGPKDYLKTYSIDPRWFGKLKNDITAIKTVRDIKSELDAWIGSVVFGLPLLFEETFPDEETVETIVEELFEKWDSFIEVKEKSVTRKIAMDRGIGVLSKLAYQIRVLKKFKREEPHSLDTLYKISNGIFRGSTRDRIRVELGKIEDRAIELTREGRHLNWTPLREFLNFTSANTQIKPRNLLAHAGLEANSVEVMLEEWSAKDIQREAKMHTFLRYSTGRLPMVKKIVANALKSM